MKRYDRSYVYKFMFGVLAMGCLFCLWPAVAAAQDLLAGSKIEDIERTMEKAGSG